MNAYVDWSGAGVIYIKKNTGTIKYGLSHHKQSNISLMLDLAANDYVVVWCEDVLGMIVQGNTTSEANFFQITKLS